MLSKMRLGMSTYKLEVAVACENPPIMGTARRAGYKSTSGAVQWHTSYRQQQA